VSGFPLTCLNIRMPYDNPSLGQEPTGPPKFFDVSVPACHSLRTPADLRTLATDGCFVLASGTLKPSPSATNASRSCTNFQGTRLPLRPTGFSVYASPVLFVSNYSYCLRHRRNTRYGWVASPYPAGTCTQQDTPSLSWRCNARAQGAALAAPLQRLVGRVLPSRPVSCILWVL